MQEIRQHDDADFVFLSAQERAFPSFSLHVFMGSGAGVLKGSPIGVQAYGGAYGYSFTFPPVRWVWEHSSASDVTQGLSAGGTTDSGDEDCSSTRSRSRSRN